MGLFSSNKQKRKDIGKKVSESLKDQKRVAGLARGYERLESNNLKLKAYKKVISAQSPQERFNRFASNASINFAKGRKRQLLFSRDVRRPLIGSGLGRRGTGKRGRPAGSYDPRYAKFGGVYGFRQYQRALYAQQRIKAIRENSISPEQNAILRQVEFRNQQRLQDPEARPIPDTAGKISLRSIHDEAEAASHLFD